MKKRAPKPSGHERIFTVLSTACRTYQAKVKAADAREAAMKAQLYPELFKWKQTDETAKQVSEVDGQWLFMLNRSA